MQYDAPYQGHNIMFVVNYSIGNLGLVFFFFNNFAIFLLHYFKSLTVCFCIHHEWFHDAAP